MSSMDLDSHQNSFWNNEKLRKKLKILHCILSMHSLSKSKDTVKKNMYVYRIFKKKSSCVCECNVPVFYRIWWHVHAYTCRHYSLFTHFSFLRCVYLGRWRHITFHIHSLSLHLCHIEFYLGYNFRTNNMSSLHCS